MSDRSADDKAARFAEAAQTRRDAIVAECRSGVDAIRGGHALSPGDAERLCSAVSALCLLAEIDTRTEVDDTAAAPLPADVYEARIDHALADRQGTREASQSPADEGERAGDRSPRGVASSDPDAAFDATTAAGLPEPVAVTSSCDERPTTLVGARNAETQP